MTFSSDNEASASVSQNELSSGQLPTTINSSNSITADLSTRFSESKYNKPSFKLEAEAESNIYVIKNGLFTRTLLPINLAKEREVVIQCTT